MAETTTKEQKRAAVEASARARAAKIIEEAENKAELTATEFDSIGEPELEHAVLFHSTVAKFLRSALAAITEAA